MSTECPRCEERGGYHDPRCPYYKPDIYALLANLNYRVPKEAAGSICIPARVLTLQQVEEVVYALKMEGIV